MAFYDRVRVAVPTKGIGPIALGPAIRGFRSFADAKVPVGESTGYVIEDLGGTFEGGSGKVLANGTFERTRVVWSTNANTPVNLSGSASLYLTPLAENLPSLGADGEVPAAQLTGTKGYAVLPQIVISSVSFAPPGDGLPAGNSSTGQRAPFQGIMPSDDPDGFAEQCTTFNNNRRSGYGRIYVKTRGATPRDYTVSSRSGDQVMSDFYQAASGLGGTGHVGQYEVVVDGALEPATSGEIRGRINISTGTGYAGSNRADYYGVRLTVAFNSKQQAWFPGARFARLNIANSAAYISAGGNFGGIIRIGMGGNLPGEAAIKFDLNQALLLDIPEPGAFEPVPLGVFNTRIDGIRRQLLEEYPLAVASIGQPANGVRSYRLGADWVEGKLIVGAADIAVGSVMRFNLSTALPQTTVFLLGVRSTVPGGIGEFTALLSADGMSLTVSALTQAAKANETYFFTILYRRS